MLNEDEELLKELEGPIKTILSVEFDNCSTQPWRVEMRSGDVYDHVVLCTGDKEVEMFSTLRDQWGVNVYNRDFSVAQEDGTRSFIDALIKCLEELRRKNEINTQEATILFK